MITTTALTLIFQIFFAAIIGNIATNMNRSFWNWFVLSIVFGLIFTGVALLVMGKLDE